MSICKFEGGSMDGASVAIPDSAIARVEDLKPGASLRIAVLVREDEPVEEPVKAGRELYVRTGRNEFTEIHLARAKDKR